MTSCTFKHLSSGPFIIPVSVPHVWGFVLLFPLHRTYCVRAVEHINYLLMLTLQKDAFFVLTHTARVSAVFMSPSCCRGNSQNLTVKSDQRQIQKSLKVIWSKAERALILCGYRCLQISVMDRKLSNVCLKINIHSFNHNRNTKPDP